MVKEESVYCVSSMSSDMESQNTDGDQARLCNTEKRKVDVNGILLCALCEKETC